MKIIYSIKDPIDEMILYNADVSICRKERNILFDFVFYSGMYNFPLEYYPHLLINIKWKINSKYKNLFHLVIPIHLLYTYPKHLMNHIIYADVVYFHDKHLNNLSLIADRCVSFEQILDELHWYNILYKNNSLLKVY